MAEDIKRNADIMRATAQCLEILTPFTLDERLTILSGVAMFGGIREALMGNVDITALLAKVKPRASG